MSMEAVWVGEQEGETFRTGARLPLRRFRVIDMSHARAGPVAVRQLSDWGAEVLRIERVQELQETDDLVGRRTSGDFQNLHRNKRSLCLDLKSKEGLEIFYRIAAEADVIVENMRPDVKYRLGTDYESIKKINPGIVFASISGYGQDGPHASRGGVDQIAQGVGGLMSVTGHPGGEPLRVGVPIADLSAGIFLAQGILVALLDREVSGRGTWVQTSLLQAQIAMLDVQAMRWLVEGQKPRPVGNDHPTGVPMGTFKTKGGERMNIAASSQRLFGKFCKAVDLTELLSDERYDCVAARRRNADALKKIVADRLMEKTAEEWNEILNNVGVPCGPVLNIEHVFENPQVEHLGIARPLQHPRLGELRLLANPVDIAGASKDFRRPTPEIGEHSHEVLAAMGFDDTQIKDLKERKIV